MSPPRTLHIVESLHRGAVETWLVRMLEHGTRRRVALDWTFYCTEAPPADLEAKARALGAAVIYSPAPLRRPLAFARALRRELRRGRYEAIHCHHDLVSGLYLLATAGLPLKRRVVHIHNADESVPTRSRLKQRLYRPTLRRLCLGFADRIAGISDHTLDTFLSGRPRRAGRDRVVFYGVDPRPFERACAARATFRQALGLSPAAPLLLFFGRMTPEKNPIFTVDILAALRRPLPETVAVFAGAGGLEGAVRERAAKLGQADAVRFLGWRSDAAEVMSACDWFVLPRPHTPMEGFGLAVVEAQLAGLRLLLSMGVSDAPLLSGACYRRLALDSGAEAWADAAADLWAAPPPSRHAALEALKASPMDMDCALAGLMELHG
ncbi:MAG: glycosyltransferase [Caulobacteraceae bacterium]